MEAKKKFIINVTYYTVIILLIVVVYKYILPIMAPFIIGFCVASLLRLPLKKRTIINPRVTRVFLVLLCAFFYVAIACIIAVFGARLIANISDFIQEVPYLVSHDVLPFMRMMAYHIEKGISSFDASLAAYIYDIFASFISQAGAYLTELSGSALKIIANGVVNVPGAIIAIILTIVSTVYFAVDYERVIRFMKNVIPKSKRVIALEGLQYAKKAVVVYIKSYSLLFAITFTELSIGMFILGMPFPLLIALGIAIFDLMPVLGTGGVLLPWAVILFFMGNTPLGLGILALYIVIAIVRNTLEPKIVGTQIGLHPLATLIALILGLKLVGLVGMIAFPITLVAVMNIRKSKSDETLSEEEI